MLGAAVVAPWQRKAADSFAGFDLPTGDNGVTSTFLSRVSSVAALASTSGEPLPAHGDTPFERIAAAATGQNMAGDSELEMVNLQHELSQRQQVVQLATNTLRALNDSAMEIIQNLGGGGGSTHGGVAASRRHGNEAAGADAPALSAAPELKYDKVQRYLVDLNALIGKAIQAAESESSGEELCEKTRIAVADLLFREWQSGALQGTRPQDGYFVKCDRTTMTQDDIDNGRLVVLIGVATLRPSEYVILRFSSAATADD